MRRGSGFLVGPLALVVAFSLAACGSDDNKTVTPTTAPGLQTINGCQIQPGTSCPGANLAAQNLQGANLTGADLATANLSRANLSNANLSGANLTGANLTGAIMIATNLSGANLTNADFAGGDLENVNLKNATHCGTIRTDGTTDNTSCPTPTTSPPPTRTPPTTIPVTPPQCDTQTFIQILASEGPAPTANGSPTCVGVDAVQPITSASGTQEMALFRVGAHASSWINWATVPIGNLPPSVAAACPSLPPAIAGLIGCPSG